MLLHIPAAPLQNPKIAAIAIADIAEFQEGWCWKLPFKLHLNYTEETSCAGKVLASDESLSSADRLLHTLPFPAFTYVDNN